MGQPQGLSGFGWYPPRQMALWAHVVAGQTGQMSGPASGVGRQTGQLQGSLGFDAYFVQMSAGQLIGGQTGGPSVFPPSETSLVRASASGETENTSDPG
jgi:hypothetical protein